MRFDRDVIDPVSRVSDWGRMVDKGTLEYEVFVPRGITLRVSKVFVPRGITLRVSIEDPLRLCFAFPGPDFPFSTSLDCHRNPVVS